MPLPVGAISYSRFRGIAFSVPIYPTGENTLYAIAYYPHFLPYNQQLAV